jgi:hypothetical protein
MSLVRIFIQSINQLFLVAPLADAGKLLLLVPPPPMVPAPTRNFCLCIPPTSTLPDLGLNADLPSPPAALAPLFPELNPFKRIGTGGGGDTRPELALGAVSERLVGGCIMPGLDTISAAACACADDNDAADESNKGD